MFINRFYPNAYYESVYEIDFGQLFENGYRGVIFDIDNTLVTHGAPQNEKSLSFINGLVELGFKVLFLSNNKEERVRTFAEPVKASYIYKAGKPQRAGYIKAMELMGTDTGNTLFIGDQIFTDVWGAKNAGIVSVLVKPIDKHEEIQIVLKRRLEWFVLKSYDRYCKKMCIDSKYLI